MYHNSIASGRKEPPGWRLRQFHLVFFIGRGSAAPKRRACGQTRLTVRIICVIHTHYLCKLYAK